ncbi:MAG: hypothetical protein ACRBBP_05290 [Bdellovibrionales bacterium]
MSKKLYLASIITLILSGCTLAPLSEPHTAQTLGNGNHEWTSSTGAGQGLFHQSISYTHGYSDNLDLGVLLEYQSLGPLIALQGKYLLSDNAKNPLSLFFGAGFGAASPTTFVYLGPIKSFKISPSYELTLNTRVNVYHWDFDDVEDQEDGSELINDIINIGIDSVNGTYVYASVNASNTLWVNERFGVTLSTTLLQFLGKVKGTTGKAALKFHYNY